MHPALARRVGLFLALAGSVIFGSVGGKPDHKAAIVAAIALTLSGFLCVLLWGLRGAPRVLLVAAVLLPVVVAVAISLGPQSSRGLYVYVSHEALVKAVDDPAGPLVVFIKAPRHSSAHALSRIYVNDRETDWHNLRGTLLSQLSLRPDWVVFIDADPNLPYAEPVQVVEIVNQLCAKPVLLTRSLWQPQKPASEGRGTVYYRPQPAWTLRSIALRN